MEIIEKSHLTKIFKYSLLSQFIPEIEDWDNKDFENLFCHATFNTGTLPEFKFQKSEKSNKKLFDEVLCKFTQEYLGDYFLVDVNFIPDLDYGSASEIGIWLKKSPKITDEEFYLKNIYLKVRSDIFQKVEILLDELVEKPYKGESEREIVLRELGKECDRYPLDKKELNALMSFSDEERKHTRIFKVLRDFKKEGLIQSYPPNFFFSTSMINTLASGWKVEFIPTEKLLKIWGGKKKQLEKISTIKIRGKPSFEENPPQIVWGDIKIGIPPASHQLCVCRILFSRELGEIVSWDEIADEIDGSEYNKDRRTGWRNVYDAVRTVNKKVKEKTGKKIFKTSRKSFSRIV